MPAAGLRGYKPVASLRLAVKVLFGVWPIVQVLALMFMQMERSLLRDWQEAPSDPPIEFFEASDARLIMIGLVRLLVVAVVGVVFLVWFNRRYENLEAFGTRQLRRTSGWSVGGWFIPFGNLVIPYQTARDIWLGTDPQRQSYP